jgi:hypothetical protein
MDSSRNDTGATADVEAWPASWEYDQLDLGVRQTAWVVVRALATALWLGVAVLGVVVYTVWYVGGIWPGVWMLLPVAVTAALVLEVKSHQLYAAGRDAAAARD